MLAPIENPDRSTVPFRDEADFERCQLNLLVAVATTVGVAVLLQLISNKSLGHWFVTLQLLVYAGACAWLGLHQQRLGRLCEHRFMSFGIGTAVLALSVLAYVGPFTAGAIVLSPIGYVFGYTRQRRVGRVVVQIASVGFAVIAALNISGVIDDGATVVAISSRRPWVAMLALTLVTEAVMWSAYFMARRSRTSLKRCFEKIEQAYQELDRRGTQLEHARWDLDHVIELAQVGHLTGTRMGGYRIGELIGRGGMGEVYRAWAAAGDQPVALKVLTPTMVDNPQMVERFFREARVSSSLESPHIVHVIDSGWADGGYPFLAMELLRGRDLNVHLHEEHTMAAPEVVELVAQVASALVVAHDVGIVHRDIKPENIFRAQGHGREGARWVVLDFGVSTVKGGSGTLTGGGMIGTPRYMAPEQARGTAVDPRADVFSLGAIVYRCLTGRAAFDAEDALGALVQVMSEQPVRPDAWVALHEDVTLVLALALAKDPATRIPSVDAFACALAAACRGELSDDLRRAAHMLLGRCPWSEPEATDPITVRPGAWPRESGEQRIHTAPLPDMLHEAFRDADSMLPPPPPFRERDESITSLASLAAG